MLFLALCQFLWCSYNTIDLFIEVYDCRGSTWFHQPLTSHPHRLSCPPSAVLGRESNHYHMASFTSLHFSISITHHITQTTRREKSGKKEHTEIEWSHGWFSKALSGTSATNEIGFKYYRLFLTERKYRVLVIIFGQWLHLKCNEWKQFDSLGQSLHHCISLVYTFFTLIALCKAVLRSGQLMVTAISEQ